MIRIVVLLLIAHFCGGVSSDDDCIINALQICGYKNGQAEEPQSPSTIKNDGSSPDDQINFKILYTELKGYYEQKVQKLQIENDLLKQFHSNSKSVHTIQTFCTCNVTDKPIANDCNNLQTNVFLEKIQGIHEQLLNITETIIQSQNEVVHSLDVHQAKQILELNSRTPATQQLEIENINVPESGVKCKFR